MYLRRESARKPASTFQAYPVYPGILAKLREAFATGISTVRKEKEEKKKKRKGKGRGRGTKKKDGRMVRNRSRRVRY